MSLARPHLSLTALPRTCPRCSRFSLCVTHSRLTSRLSCLSPFLWLHSAPGQSPANRRSYLKNTEKRREKSKRWRQENPRAKDAQKARRRAAIKGSRTGPTPHWQIVQRLAIWAGECAYCGKKEQEQDHFIPLNRGGSHCIENIVPCCRSCNASKSDKDAWDWYCSQPFFAMQRWVKLVEVVEGADRGLGTAA